MSITRPWATVLILCLSLWLSACGGGGGGSSTNNSNSGGSGGTGTTPPPDTGGPTTPPPTPTTGLSLSTTTLTFHAASPNSPVPADQFVTATYNGTVTGTLRIVPLQGDDVQGVRPMDSMTIFGINYGPGEATVRPTSPDLLGPGTYTQTVLVRACVDGNSTCSGTQLPGSPQTITITYVVGAVPPPPDAVMPHVAIAGEAGRVIVRGSGLSGMTTVHFGPHAATNVSVVSDTEVHATYPALANGTYAVSLNSGTIPFTGSIVATPVTSYASDTIDLPEEPSTLAFLRYDAERSALLVGGSNFASTGVTSKLWRFTHDGTDWGLTRTVDLAGLNDAVISADGSHVLAVADAGVVELSAQDLSISRSTPRPTQPLSHGNQYFYSIAIANNGLAVINALTQAGLDQSPIYYFSTTDRTLHLTRTGLGNSSYSRRLLGTMDGSLVLGSIIDLYPSQPQLNYDASSALRTYRIPTTQRIPTMATRHGQIIVASRRDGFPLNAVVYSAQSDTPLGVLPGPANGSDSASIISLVEVNPRGTRAYVVRADNTLHTYALDQPTIGDAFQEVGTPITLTAPKGYATMTPDGRTLFLGNALGVLVIPTLD